MDSIKIKPFEDNDDNYSLLYDRTIGYTQIYQYSGEKFDCIKDYKTIFEFDIFIGEEQFLSKGFGTLAVKTICNQIYSDFHADCIVLQPAEANERAIKCYMKAGFQFLCKYNGHDTLGNPEAICVLYAVKA